MQFVRLNLLDMLMQFVRQKLEIFTTDCEKVVRNVNQYKNYKKIFLKIM